MKRALGRWSVMGVLALALAAACGSDDAQRKVKGVEAGEAGQAGDGTGLSAGGNQNRAGTPPVIEAGAGGAPEPELGGAAGEPSLAGTGGDPGLAGMGGEPPLVQGGQGGEPVSVQGGQAGEGGVGEPAPTCCQPLDCSSFGPGECGDLVDPCTGELVICGCGDNEVCDKPSNTCQTCGPDPCTENPYLCGETHDACGNPVTCEDNCEAITGGFGTCYEGSCCTFDTYFCSAFDCGTMDIGCGQFLECGDTCEGTDTCQPNNECCTPSVECTEYDCGLIDDGCGNEIDCGDPCVNDYKCSYNTCRPSVCLANDLECGLVENPEIPDPFEDCGTCAEGLGCVNNHCLPMCTIEPG